MQFDDFLTFFYLLKVIKGVRIVEAITKKHGQYKLSINDILGASKFKPVDLTGAEIVIVLGPLKKNQRRRDFLWAELAEDWQGPESNKENVRKNKSCQKMEFFRQIAMFVLILENNQSIFTKKKSNSKSWKVGIFSVKT